MTNGKNAAAWAKAKIDTPYDDIDCIKLVVLAIRNGKGASGESLTYQCGGCNELWRSLNASGRYRYITRRIELESAKTLGLLLPGALLCIWKDGYNADYKDYEGNCDHIGIYVGDNDCEVVHSSATKKKVCASTLANGWTHVLIHRLIDLENGDAAELDYRAIDTPYEATVITQKDPLTIRMLPSSASRSLGKVKKGGTMTVVGLAEYDDDGREWLPVEAAADNRRSAVRGWAASEYLMPVADSQDTAGEATALFDTNDSVRVPRNELLALADALHALEASMSFNAADYLTAISALSSAAGEIIKHLEGDD